MLYADELELGNNSREVLWDVIKKVDAAFLKLIAEKTQPDTPTPGRGKPRG